MTEGFDALKGRLDEIVEEVGREGISLDEALRLYEEAVNIGIAACDASELDVPAEGAEAEVEGAEAEVEAEGAEAEVEVEVAEAEADAEGGESEADAEGGESEADDAEAEIATETISDVESN